MTSVEQSSSIETAPDHRSGFVAVVGRPNVGKSSLINRLLGQKIAIVTPKPQTTRNRLTGILTLEKAQVILCDTPGLHVPRHRLGEALVRVALDTLADADVVLWVVDVSVVPHEEDRAVAGALSSELQVSKRRRRNLGVVLALNKADRLGRPHRLERRAPYVALAPDAESIFVSAKTGENLDLLLEILIDRLPLGPRYYPEEQVTDQQERFMAAEMVREQVLYHLRDEVPHAVAVQVNEFTQRSEELTYISAVVFVERETQKGILLGRDGSMIGRIGQAARAEIEELLGTRVYLDLWVKVRPGWRSEDSQLRRLGYQPPSTARGRKRATAKRR